MDIKEILAKNVKLYRSRLGYTQERLSEKCYNLQDDDALSNRSFISDIENGKRNIALDKVALLAMALNVEPYELFLTKEISDKI